MLCVHEGVVHGRRGGHPVSPAHVRDPHRVCVSSPPLLIVLYFSPLYSLLGSENKDKTRSVLMKTDAFVSVKCKKDDCPFVERFAKETQTSL